MPASFYSILNSSFFILHYLEVVSEADFQAKLRVIAEVVQAHVNINGGLDADMVVQIEAVTNLGRQIGIVIHRSFATCTPKSIPHTTTEEEAVVLHVVARTGTKLELVCAVLMIPTNLSEKHPVVCDKVAGTCSDAKMEARSLGPIQTEARE